MQDFSTEPILDRGENLRLDPKTGALRARRYVLAVDSGPDAGKSVAVDAPMKVGTSPDCGLVVSDATISRFHFELTPGPDGVRVRDLDSTNGTLVAGLRIQDAILEGPKLISAGKSAFRLEVIEEDLGQPAPRGAFGGVVGTSAAMQRLFGVLERVAPTVSTVLLLGETGTGKEVLARAIHHASQRSRGHFVVVDCTAIPSELAESELFGHVKGSFTGAAADRQGAFLEAHGGTLFLDEVGELPLALQPKLLRALESGTVKRVGEDGYRSVDVRIVAATNRALEAEVAAGRFRSDLYFRLAVVPAPVPPLRERAEDLPALIHHFLLELGRPDFALSDALLGQLRTYRWPGNVRELRNVVERVVAGDEPRLSAAPVSAPRSQLLELPFKEAKEKIVGEFMREYLVALLERCDGNISEMARAASLNRNHVQKLVDKLGLR